MPKDRKKTYSDHQADKQKQKPKPKPSTRENSSQPAAPKSS